MNNNRLTPIRFVRKDAGNHAMWLFRCSCGNERVLRLGNVKYGYTRSCGCLGKEAQHNTRAEEYGVWCGMKQRCLNPDNGAYANYGGRGITVCQRWQASFQNFIKDMGARPTSRHSIDRIDNDGSYEPGNCRWATSIEQAENTRASRLLTFNGERLTLARWAKRVGIDRGSLRSRLDNGWSIESALTTGKLRVGRRKAA